jgi:hypothetical protein
MKTKILKLNDWLINRSAHLHNKILIVTLINLLIITSTYAQSPQNISYQAVIRNSSNSLVTSSPVGMRISILQGSAAGTEVYKEIFNPNPQTNTNGLVTVEIGSGVPLTGTFAAIDWSVGPYFVKTETDPAGGTNYTITGTSQLLSVPYAKYADEAGNGFSGNYNDLTNQPLLATVATTGSYTDLTNQPSLATVATSGSYTDLANQPALSTVASTGSYSDLTGVPANIDIDKTDDVLLSGNQTIAGTKTFTGTVNADSLHLTRKTSKWMIHAHNMRIQTSASGTNITLSYVGESATEIQAVNTGTWWVLIPLDIPYQVLGNEQKIKSVTFNYMCNSANVYITNVYVRKHKQNVMTGIVSSSTDYTSTTVQSVTLTPTTPVAFDDSEVDIIFGITYTGVGTANTIEFYETMVNTQ